MRQSKLRVVLVDDHEVVRAGVRAILDGEEGLEVVGEAGTADEALAIVAREAPDAVLMDIALPDASGIDLTRRIRSTYPHTQVVILTFHEGEEYFTQALRAGAAGYVVKGSPAADIKRALEAVAAGETYLSPRLASGLVTKFLDGQGEVALAGLTSREREVADLLVEGLSNQEIALKLDISVTTVQTHRSHIMEKLGVRNYGEFVRFAIRNGLISP